MDYNHQRKVSLLEGEEIFFNKNLSRDSSTGCSSRILYYRSINAEGVPFKWEMQPGTPKEPPQEDAIPPLSPPPAVLSLGLPKPCIEVAETPSKASVLKSKLTFWKRSKKSHCVDSFVNMEFYSSDGEEFMASPRNSSCSTSSSSLNSSQSSSSSSRGQGRVREKFDRLLHGGCSPWHITSVLVRVGRRI